MNSFSFTVWNCFYLVTISFGVAFNLWFFMNQYLISRVRIGVSLLIITLFSALAVLLFPYIPVLIRSFSAPLGTLLLVLILYRGSPLRKIGIVTVYQVCILFMDAFVMSSMKLLGISVEAYMGNQLFAWITNAVISNITLIPIALLLRPVLQPKGEPGMRHIRETVGILAFLFLSVTIMIDFAFLSFSAEKTTVLAFICMAATMLVAAVLLLFWLLKRIDFLAKMNQKKIIAEKECEFALERQNQEVRYQEEIAALEKRMSFQLEQLSGWIANGRIPDAVSELERSIADVQKIRRPQMQPNHLVDYLLAGLSERCDQAGIRLDIKVSLPSSIGVKDVDFCTILSNLIDNAVKAACSARNEKRFIHLDIHRNGDILFIGCENSKSHNADKETNPRRFGHLGLINIREAVSKYEGDVQIENHLETFRIQVMLYCEHSAD